MNIVRATKKDCTVILELIKELAQFEKAAEEVVATKEDLEKTLFQDNPSAFCDLAIVDGQVIGFALWFLNYSTWQSKYGIYLEDLYVKTDYRGQGVGRKLLSHLARICIDNGYGRLQWWVLDWNSEAIKFYESIGAKPMDEWTVWRVSETSLKKLADQ